MQVHFSGISEVRFYNTKNQNLWPDLLRCKDSLTAVGREWNSQGGFFVNGTSRICDRFFDLNDVGTRDKTIGMLHQKRMQALNAKKPPSDNVKAWCKFIKKETELKDRFNKRMTRLIKAFDALPEDEKTIQNILVHPDRDDPNRVVLETLPPGNRKIVL